MRDLLDRLCLGVAQLLLPRRLVSWAFTRVVCHGTTGRYSGQEVPALTAMDALKRWNEDHRL